MCQLSQTRFAKHGLACRKHSDCLSYKQLDAHQLYNTCGNKIVCVTCSIMHGGTVQVELMETEHESDESEMRREEKRALARARANAGRMFCQSRTDVDPNLEIACLELADASCDVTTRRWWITRAITAWVVTALQITGDAAYYTTGGWRVHNVVVHALL